VTGPSRQTYRAVSKAAFLVAALALGIGSSACGGPMRPEELKRSIDTLESSAAEGRLLARDVAEDRTKATFARAHARELADGVDHEGEKLTDATPRREIVAEKAAAVSLADDISQVLGKIQQSPQDESVGREAENQLDDLTRRAKQLGDRL
jgi:hypothetical protein